MSTRVTVSSQQQTTDTPGRPTVPLRKLFESARCGAATVEFALCAPVFFLVVFAGIEIARVNLIIQTVESACLQAGRRGIVPGATAESVADLGREILASAQVRDYQIEVTPELITPQSETVSIEITVPMSGNGYIAPQFFGGKVLTRTMTFKRE